MAAVQTPDDESANLSGHRPHVDSPEMYAADHGSAAAFPPGGGPVRFPRREHSLEFREAGLSATESPSPSPSHHSSVQAAHKYYHMGESLYDQRHYPPSLSTATSTYAADSNWGRDPRPRPIRLIGSPTPSHGTPSPPISPRWDSLPRSQPALHHQPMNSSPSSPIAPSVPYDQSYPVYELDQSIDSLASETRDEFPALPTVRANGEGGAPVENFSRPRGPSIRQVSQETPRVRSPLQPYYDHSQHDGINASAYPWPRPRGPSTSSNQSASTFASLAVRHEPLIRDPPRGRLRQYHPPAVRPPVSYNRAESSGPTFARDPIPRMASLPNDELRSSYRSQLSGSTAQGTLLTERSSVLTKSSSITSVYGNIDDSLSVDDVLGLYDKGFDDDSSPEDTEDYNDSQRASAVSDESSSKGDSTSLDTMSEATAAEPRPPRPPFADDGPIVRDSAAIFRISKHERTPSEDTTMKQEPDEDDSQNAPSPITRPPPPARHDTTMTLTGDDKRDRYGFKKSNQYITCEEYDKWDSVYSEYLVRRRKKWNIFLKENGLMTDSPNRFPPRSAKAKRFVRKGIPPEWRGAAWFYYAGGPAIQAKNAGLYDELLTQSVKDVDAEAIERDLHRTFPDNIRFRSTTLRGVPVPDDASSGSSQKTMAANTADRAAAIGETAMISSLRRVLYAFSIYNPRIGYCQSLNFLAGLLLLFVESEEQAFWLLNIVTRVYLPGTHETSLEGANVDLGVLMSAIRDTMPNVWAKIGGELDGTDAPRPKSRRHRQRAELTTRLPPITLCMTAWFMSCFIGTLPIESTLRVWDVFFYEGSKTLFRVALTIFKLGEPEIRKVGDPMEIFQVVQTIPRRMLDANGLMEACYKRRNPFNHLTQESIELRRQDRRRQVKAEKERLAAGEPLLLPDQDVSRKGTLFKRRVKDRTQRVGTT
ncbi:RabGAP/TBC [Xylariaceae sp. FL0594]|nr:RabGAP/TBC [Xylariaceae sp. FL0594]